MRVRHLQAYLREQKFARISDLSVCRGMRVGIDAVYFFRSLKSLNDPLSNVSGSLSPGFIPSVEEQLQYMDSLELQPLFVFQGMQPKSHMLLSVQIMGFAMHDAWAAYARGDRQLATSKFFPSAYKEFSEESVHLLVSYLKSTGREVVRAPYFAIAQLSYFAQEGLIDAVVAPPSVLLFGIPRVIISLDLCNNTFEWVELEEILSRCNLERDQLIDACLLAGTEHCLSYPFLSQQFSFSTAIECIKQASLIRYLCQLPSREGIHEYVDGYCVGKTLVTYPLVMTLSGDVAPLFRRSTLPSDYHKIVGSRLPRQLYYLMCEGLIGVQLPFTLAIGEWIDEPNPNADSMEYRDLLQDVREYHCRALGLIVLRLGEPFQTRQIRFQGLVSVVKGHPPIKQSAIVMIPNTFPVRRWLITRDNLKEELKRQNLKSVSIEMLLKWHLHSGDLIFDRFSKNYPDTPVSNTHSDLNGHSTWNTYGDNYGDSGVNVGRGDCDVDDEMVLSAKLHFMLLDNLGYFTREGGATAFGKVLANSTLGLSGLLILELLKFGIFTGDQFEAPQDCPYAPELVYQPITDEDLQRVKAINLVARLSTICPLQWTDCSSWRGEVDFDVACFSAALRLLKRSINYLSEGCLANLILPHLSKIELSIDSSKTFPFYYEKCTFMGVVVKSLLLMDSTLENQNTHEGFMEILKTNFPNCTNLAKDLEKLAEFWLRIHKMLHQLKNYVHLGIALETFDHGTRILTRALSKVGINVNSLIKIIN